MRLGNTFARRRASRGSGALWSILRDALDLTVQGSSG